MEEELCLIFSGADPDPPSTSSWVESEVAAMSGLKSEEGEVRLLALPVELKKALVSGERTQANTGTPGRTMLRQPTQHNTTLSSLTVI